MLLLASNNGVISERLAADLADVEGRFAAELVSELSCVNDLVRHVEQYRGKMLRPTLVLLSAMATSDRDDGPGEAKRVLATVVEMVHMATLVHDDILDEAQMRRRGATINALSGNEAAVMLGDYLISHAYHLCSSLSRPALSRIVASATNTVCEGELLQLANRNNLDLDEQTYFEIIRRKTASLCGTCCRLGVLAGESGTEDETGEAASSTADALYAYGEKLGVAFQIVDDLLDLTGEEQVVGKTLGLDLEKGKLTLPLIRFFEQASGGEAKQMRELIRAQSQPTLDDASRSAAALQLRDRLEATDAVDYARDRAAGLITEAKAAVRGAVTRDEMANMLVEMADMVLARRF